MRPRSDTLLVWTGAACSYGCSACPINGSTADAGARLADLADRVTGLAARAARLAVLVGGEPFLRPDLLRLIAATRAAGCVPGLVTTGRPLVYAPVREKLLHAGLAYLRVQLFGIGATHDRAAAVPGAFDQALAGLRAWVADAGERCDVDVALSLRGRSPAGLADDVEFLARELAAPAVQIVIAIDPPGEAEPGALEPLRAAATALADWNDGASRPLLAWEGFPPDTLPAGCLRIAALAPAFFDAVPRACCLGGLAARTATAGAGAAQANSFNFVRTTTHVPRTADAGTCGAQRASGAGDPDRQLWLVEDDHLVLYATDTGDFDQAAIARIKDTWSHLFLDCAPAGVLDDFVDGMRRVVPDPICDPCPHRLRCGRRFRAVAGAPFAREEAWIAAHISALRGRVLDVGCGEQLYRDALAPLVRAGTVRYTGLDPDQPSLERLREALPEGRYQLGGVEDFRGEPSSYDHILCLRSLNHVADLDEAMARMAALLTPGGSLLIVETTPFAMLRSAEQVAAADLAPRAGHQHFRNVTSEEVLPYARRRGLRVVEHHPVGRESTNEWILLLERPGGAPP